MSDEKLANFYEFWKIARNTDGIKMATCVKEALEYFKNISDMPEVNCERTMFIEIAQRWHTEVTSYKPKTTCETFLYKDKK